MRVQLYRYVYVFISCSLYEDFVFSDFACMFTVIIFFISNTCIGMYSSLYPPLSTVCVFINLHIESRRLVIFGANVTCIGLEYPVFLNLYVIYRSNMICKWTLHIFGNLIAHWLLASQSASPLMPGLAWGYSLCGSEAKQKSEWTYVTASPGNSQMK